MVGWKQRRRHPRIRVEFDVRTLLRLGAAILLAAAAGRILVAVEHSWNLALPSLLRFPPESARILLGALFGGIVTLAGFTFWMRAIVVQLVSSAVSPRVLCTFLEDRFQAGLLGFMAAAVAFVAAVLAGVPGEAGAEGSPDVAVLLALLLGLTALLALLFAMQSSVRAMQVGEIVRRIADRASARMADESATRPRGPVPLRDPDDLVRSPETGWLGSIGCRAIEGLLDERTIVAMDVQEGDFVSEGSRLGRIWMNGRSHPGLAEEIARHVSVSRTQDGIQGVSVEVDRLVDIAERAMGAGTVNAATIHEVTAHLGWLLERSLEDGRSGEDGPNGNLLLPRWWTGVEVLRDAFDRLRMNGAQHPPVAKDLVGALGNVLDRVPDEHRTAAVVHDIAEEVLDEVRSNASRGSDGEAVVEIARSRGLLSR